MDTNTKPKTIRISAQRKELLATYAEATSDLSAVISIADFVEVFNHYEEDKTNENEALLGLQRYAKANAYTVEYGIYQNYITGPTLHPDDFEDQIEEMEWYLEQQKDKPRYLPDKEEFLRYSTIAGRDYYRSPEKPYADLKSYILKNKLANDDDPIHGVDGDLMDLHEFIQEGLEPMELIGYFNDREYLFKSQAQLQEFLNLVMEAYNHTRRPENNGFTPFELCERFEKPKLQPQQGLRLIKKTGRNDPCPCGSGNKYKRCCLR